MGRLLGLVCVRGFCISEHGVARSLRFYHKAVLERYVVTSVITLSKRASRQSVLRFQCHVKRNIPSSPGGWVAA
jgi:hypothetical protein